MPIQSSEISHSFLLETVVMAVIVELSCNAQLLLVLVLDSFLT